MRKVLVALTAMALLALAVPALSADYVGVKKCGMCHKSDKKGDQLGKWEASKHAKAYETLASDEAKKVAADKGLGDPQKEEACLKCHTVKGAPDPENGVTCEACHGPGSEYKSMKTMKDREAAIKAGLVIPDEKTCKGCHNSESPTFKEFNYDEMWKKIAHPNPNK